MSSPSTIAGHADTLETPIGPLAISVAADGAVLGVRFGSWPEHPTPAPRQCADVRRQLAEYFAGERRRFELELRPAGSAFQQRVWHALLDIDYGTTASYADIAARVGGSARAVGRANATNPIAIIIPCHRVIGADGSLTGYGGGLERKRRLLELEGALSPELF